MSVGQDAVGKVFHVGQYSTGTVADPTTDPIVYTEGDAAPGAMYGAGDITITGVSTTNGVTTITGTVATSFGPQNLSATLIGNDTSDILVQGSFGGQTSYVFLTNQPTTTNAPQVRILNAAQPAVATTTHDMGQPGVGNTASVDAPNDVAYSPTAACYASGTRIRLERGNVAVEDLVVGDRAVTASGELRAIRWIGHRTIDCGSHPRPRDIMPIRIAAHAFGPDRPARDLFVSPGHAICVDVMGEVLIPAASLHDGMLVTRNEVERVTYWHVELDSHDVLLAENLPAESYLEMGNRGFFAESEAVQLFASPDAPVPTHADFCRPFHDQGPLVAVARAHLAARAAAMGVAPKRAAA